MDQFKKCDKAGCCEHLLKRVVQNGRGFYAIDTVKFNEPGGGAKTRFPGIAYKNKASDAGLLLNWCPFCGGQPGDFLRLV